MITEESLYFRYNIDENGTPISLKIDRENKQVTSAHCTIQLEQVPDELHRVAMFNENGQPMTEVFNRDEVAPNSFYVDYGNGIAYFHSSQSGKFKLYDYYGKGLIMIGSSRIFDEHDVTGKGIVLSLQEIIDKGKECIQTLFYMGDAKKIVDKLDEKINTGTVLHENLTNDIEIATPLQEDLHSDIVEANTFREQLNQDVANGAVLSSELRQNVIDGENINADLEYNLVEGQGAIDLIRGTGNTAKIITTSDWVGTAPDLSYTWNHGLGTKNLTVEVFDNDTNETLFWTTTLVDNNNIKIESDEAKNIRIVLSAKYYMGGMDTKEEIIAARKGKTDLKTKIDEMDISLEANLNSINSAKNKNTYQDYRYIATTFNSTEMKLVLMCSNDGINWDVFGKTGIFQPSTLNKTLRDPSIIKVKEYYYITYTRIDWGTGNNIGFCRTRDFLNFEELNDLSFDGFNKIWAPEFFRDYITNNTYVLFNGSTDGTNFKPFISQVWFSDEGVSTIGNHKQILGDFDSKNVIDVSIFQDNNRYYLSLKDETNKYNEIYESFELLTGYKILKSNLFANHEGLQIIKLDNGGFRIYGDNYSDRTIGLGYWDTYDGFNSFTEFKKIITEDFNGAHCFILDSKPPSKVKQYDKSFMCITNSTNISVPSSTDFILNFDTIKQKSDFAIENNESILIGSNGMFIVKFSVTWQDVSDENERTIDILLNDKVVGKSQSRNLPLVWYNQTAIALLYCNIGDRIKFRSFQKSGGNIDIIKTHLSPNVEIIKVV